MNTSWGLELVLGERLAERRREAEHDRVARLAQFGDGGGRMRRGGSVRRPGWMGLIRAAGIRLLHRPTWRGADFFSTHQGPQP